MTQQLLAEAPELAHALRRELLRLAELEDALAAQEASSVPYWAPCPNTVLGHRQAARALRAEADRCLDQAFREGAVA